MIVDMWQTIVNEADGHTLKNTIAVPGVVVNVETAPDLRLCDVIGHALLNANWNGESDRLSAEEKVARWQLARRIFRNPIDNYSIEDLALMKRLVGQCYLPLLVGPVFEMLEHGMPAVPNLEEGL